MKVVERTKAPGVLVGVPFYFPSSPGNAVRFYRDIAAMFPKLAIMVYHNPDLHNVRLTLPVIEEIVKIPNVVAMKDSHRSPVEFMRLMKLTRGKMTTFVNTVQFEAVRAAWSDRVFGRSTPGWAPGRCSRCAMRSAPVTTRWRPRSRSSSPVRVGAARRTSSGARRAPKSGSSMPVTSIRDRCARRSSKFPPEVDAAQRKSAERWQALSKRYAPVGAL